MFLLLLLLWFANAVSWPASAGVDISANLPAGYEPSGVTWHPYYNSLFIVSDGGFISKMNLDGSNVTTWNVAGDLEGVTIGNPNSELVYVLVEYPYAVIKFNPSTGQAIRVFLTGVIPATANSNSGLEGITFVPNGLHSYANSSNGGLFYVGVQETGAINVVDVDFNANNARLVASFAPVAGRGDIAGLHFNTETKTLFVLYDGANLIREIYVNNTLINEYAAAGLNQEGFTLLPSCPNASAIVVIAEDSGRVMKYENYPVNCIQIQVNADNDGDGFFQNVAPVDCNDNNAAINPGAIEVKYNQIDDDCNFQTLDYIDADNDGFNSNVDCNDYNPNVNPARNEVLNNELDDDCNMATSDLLQPSAWPSGVGVLISQNLPAGYEPSGVTWHPYYNALFTVWDNGFISKLDLEGGNVTTWRVDGDLEGITNTGEDSEFVYAAVEYPYGLIKFNPLSGRVESSVSLAGVIPVNSNEGITGLTYVSNGHHPYSNSQNDGLFYAGLEANGVVYVVDVNFETQTAALIDSFTPVINRKDLEGLHYNPTTRTLFVLYDESNLLREITLSNSFVNEYSLPTNTKDEGVTITPICAVNNVGIIIAQDSGSIIKYQDFPSNCQNPRFDEDEDGFFANAEPFDCNDSNAAINPSRVEVVENGVDDDCNAQTFDVLPVIRSTMEAEAMPILSGRLVRRLADSIAFYTNGYAQETWHFDSGIYNITILARADTVQGRSANMRVQIDGVTMANFPITTQAFAPVTLTRNLTEGNHTVRIRFTNDYYVRKPRQDVNLYVDKLIFEH